VRTPAVVIASSIGSTRAPIARDITCHKSSFGRACNSSKIVNVGDKPSFVYASDDSTRYTAPFAGTSIVSLNTRAKADISGDISIIRFAVPNTMRACSRSAAHEYTCAPCTPRNVAHNPIPDANADFPFFLGTPTSAVRCRNRPSGRCAKIRRIRVFCHGINNNG